MLIAQGVVATSGPDKIRVGDAVMLWSVHANPGRDVRAEGGVLVESPGVYNSLNKALESDEILSNVVDCIFEGGDPGGQVNEYGDLRRLRVSTGLDAILEADTRAH